MIWQRVIHPPAQSGLFDTAHRVPNFMKAIVGWARFALPILRLTAIKLRTDVTSDAVEVHM